MLIARVIRKIPKMKAMMRRVEKAIRSALAQIRAGRHSTLAASAVNRCESGWPPRKHGVLGFVRSWPESIG
jgi:hypothetical protein